MHKVRVTVAVHDQRTQKSTHTRAFPSGQDGGCFSAPVSFDAEVHWVHVQIEGESAHVLSGTRVPSRTFQLTPVHESSTRLVNGAGCIEYDVAKRFHVSVMVEGLRH